MDWLGDIGIAMLIVVGIIAKIGESAINGNKRKGSAPKSFDEITEEELARQEQKPSRPTERGNAGEYEPEYQPTTVSHTDMQQTFTTTTTAAPAPFLTTELSVATESKPVNKQHASDKHAAHKANAKQHGALANGKKTAKKSPESEPTDFDLREAVIYSEILAPKFKDYD